MIRAAMFSTVLLAAALGAAQTSSASSAASSQNNNSPSSTTIRGCLSSSSLGDNHFTLTQNQTGTVFTLSGQAEQLQSQVGHEVEITGNNISNSGNSANKDESTSAGEGSTSNPGDTGNNALEVKGVKMVTDHCTASSVGPSGGPDIPHNSASSSSPHRSNRGAAEVFGHKASIDEAHNLPNAVSSIDSPLNDNLPANARVLPLLGVVGLCSLFAGFAVRR